MMDLVDRYGWVGTTGTWGKREVLEKCRNRQRVSGN